MMTQPILSGILRLFGKERILEEENERDCGRGSTVSAFQSAHVGVSTKRSCSRPAMPEKGRPVKADSR